MADGVVSTSMHRRSLLDAVPISVAVTSTLLLVPVIVATGLVTETPARPVPTMTEAVPLRGTLTLEPVTLRGTW